MTDTPTNTTLGDFCPKNKFAKRPDIPLEESELNWIFKNRENNGFAEAFVKVTARNYLVHVPTFIQCLASRRGA